MALTLQDFGQNDQNYVNKLNSNNDVLEGAVGALQTQLGAAAGNVATLPAAFRALFGAATTRIGSSSLAAGIVGQTVEVDPGYAFLASNQVVVESAGGAVDLAGQSNGTYYVKVDTLGSVVFDDDPVDALC